MEKIKKYGLMGLGGAGLLATGVGFGLAGMGAGFGMIGAYAGSHRMQKGFQRFWRDKHTYREYDKLVGEGSTTPRTLGQLEAQEENDWQKHLAAITYKNHNEIYEDSQEQRNTHFQAIEGNEKKRLGTSIEEIVEKALDQKKKQTNEQIMDLIYSEVHSYDQKYYKEVEEVHEERNKKSLLSVGGGLAAGTVGIMAITSPWIAATVGANLLLGGYATKLIAMRKNRAIVQNSNDAGATTPPVTPTPTPAPIPTPSVAPSPGDAGTPAPSVA